MKELDLYTCARRRQAMRPIRVLSLGWGVQSFTLAAMAAVGELDIDVAIHADTGWEHEATYEFIRVWAPKLRTAGVKIVHVEARQHDPIVLSRSANKPFQAMIPAFTLDGKKKGQLRRQCTDKWKIRPMRAALSAAMRRRGMKKTPGSVELLLGISLDEFQRARDSDVRWITNTFPLLDRRMSRADCEVWLVEHDFPVPPKSSCVFCPYKNGSAWRALKGNDLKTAIEVDTYIRDKRPPYPLFIHPSRKPLGEVIDLPVLEEGCPGGYCFI